MKIYLVHDNQRISKKKTHIKKRSLNPVFNESFIFDLPSTDGGLSSCHLEFVMLDWDRVTKNEVQISDFNPPSSWISISGYGPPDPGRNQELRNCSSTLGRDSGSS